MALSRRTGSRFQASIWPGFVDAMTGLLLVLMFVLTIFMVVQFVLTEQLSGQETELDALSNELVALAEALGLEEQTNATLDARVGELSGALAATRVQLADQDRALESAAARITNFEAQVAALLNERDVALGQVDALQGERTTLLSAQDALNAALAASRDEINAQVETARLAAARRAALDALIADLRARNADVQEQLETSQDALSAEETARLSEAAAAEALRARLADADTELTAMTLALEAQRKKAEDTLTLLAAARSVEDDLDGQLAAALLAMQDLQAQTVDGKATMASLRAENEGLAGQVAALQQQLQSTKGALETDLAQLRGERDVLQSRLAASQTAQEDLNARLATALAQLETSETEFTADRDTLRQQLAAALAARLAAETLAGDTTSEAERRAALLAAANGALQDEKAISAKAQRQTELLNQQVAALRGELGQLQALLDDAVARDAAQAIQLQSLGSNLNTALARVAAEQSRRAELEAAERERLERETKDLERYRSEFFGRLRDVLGTQDGVRIEGDRFVFSSEVLFPPGQAQLSPEGQGEIAKVAEILRKVATDIPEEIDWIIRVDGHTDDQPLSGFGEFADNWELSQARALSVVRYMYSFLGISPGRLSANGFGEYQPIAEGSSDEARALNRRIELKFTEK